jgi:nicotinamidase-related amidase
MNCALLLLHLQQGIVAPYGDAAQDTVGAARVALDGARAHGVPVLHVPMVFRPGLPEFGPDAKASRFVDAFVEGAPATESCPELVPQPGELVTVGRRASAFAGTDLDIVLRTLGVDQLALSGVGTSGVVLGTFIGAADLGYGLTILSDACWDPDPEVHTMLMTRIFPMRATIQSVADWGAQLG